MFLIITNKLCNLPRWVVHYLSVRPRSVHVHKVIVVIVSVRSGGVKQAENLSFGGEGEKIETGAPVFAIFSLFFSKPPHSFSRFGHVTLCQIKQLEESVVIVDSVEHVIVLNYGENCDFNDSLFLFVWPRFLILGNNGSKSVSYDPLVWSVEIIKRVVHANRVHFCEI